MSSNFCTTSPIVGRSDGDGAQQAIPSLSACAFIADGRRIHFFGKIVLLVKLTVSLVQRYF